VMLRTSPIMKNYPASNVTSAEVENPPRPIVPVLQ
jgi:hypothetical protein